MKNEKTVYLIITIVLCFLFSIGSIHIYERDLQRADNKIIERIRARNDLLESENFELGKANSRSLEREAELRKQYTEDRERSDRLKSWIEKQNKITGSIESIIIEYATTIKTCTDSVERLQIGIRAIRKIAELLP